MTPTTSNNFRIIFLGLTRRTSFLIPTRPSPTLRDMQIYYLPTSRPVHQVRVGPVSSLSLATSRAGPGSLR